MIIQNVFILVMISVHMNMALMTPGWKLFLALKPVDWWTLLYLIATLPLTVWGDGIIIGALLRFIAISAILILRWWLLNAPLRSYCMLLCRRRGWLHISFGSESSCVGMRGDAWIHTIYMTKTVCFLLDWYAPLLWAYSYAEIGSLIRNIYGPPDSTHYYDDWVLWWEYRLFREQPAHDMRKYSLSDRIFGEYLHFCYFSFYFIIFGTLLAIYFYKKKRRIWDASLSAISLVFYVCFSIYLIWPVKGPYYSLQQPDADEVGYVFSHLVRHLLNSESSQGTATPSSHCAIATAFWVVAWLFLPLLGLFFFLLVPGLVLATVWCGFHYGMDALGGVVLGLILTLIAIAITMKWPYLEPRCSKEKHCLIK